MGNPSNLPDHTFALFDNPQIGNLMIPVVQKLHCINEGMQFPGQKLIAGMEKLAEMYLENHSNCDQQNPANQFTRWWLQPI